MTMHRVSIGNLKLSLESEGMIVNITLYLIEQPNDNHKEETPMVNFMLTLLKHRVTWRFLLVLSASLGASGLLGFSDQLEAIGCALLTCGD
ncbi:putative transmembrane protein [Pectobacterium phage Q19]|uniref:Transmembrane protein n=1 Tax=Pectobacterium phage Q19 TaxID=2500576 RepID=A0A678ZT42_9CAUD|nr:putative transmembrane protein [Pectobacterium phage Q19]